MLHIDYYWVTWSGDFKDFEVAMFDSNQRSWYKMGISEPVEPPARVLAYVEKPLDKGE